jgi:hypothetical protein
MTKQDIQNEIKSVKAQFKNARACSISSYLDELTEKLNALHNLLEFYEWITTQPLNRGFFVSIACVKGLISHYLILLRA